MTKELQAFQKEVEADNARRADDCTKALKELMELREQFDAMTSGSACDAEYRRMVDKKHATEETKSDLPPPPPTRAEEARAAGRGDDLSALHPDDLKLAQDATPTEEEAQMMIYLMSKMKYQALGVENDQLRKQIADLQDATAE